MIVDAHSEMVITFEVVTVDVVSFSVELTAVVEVVFG